METFFDVKIKNHKVLKKPILYMTHMGKRFELNKQERDALIGDYITEIQKHKNLIVIMDFRNIDSWDKKSIWEGSSDLKKHEEIAIKHVDKVLLITENKMLRNLLTIVLKIIKNKIDTKCYDKLSNALSSL